MLLRSSSGHTPNLGICAHANLTKDLLSKPNSKPSGQSSPSTPQRALELRATAKSGTSSATSSAHSRQTEGSTTYKTALKLKHDNETIEVSRDMALRALKAFNCCHSEDFKMKVAPYLVADFINKKRKREIMDMDDTLFTGTSSQDGCFEDPHSPMSTPCPKRRRTTKPAGTPAINNISNLPSLPPAAAAAKLDDVFAPIPWLVRVGIPRFLARDSVSTTTETFNVVWPSEPMSARDTLGTIPSGLQQENVLDFDIPATTFSTMDMNSMTADIPNTVTPSQAFCTCPPASIQSAIAQAREPDIDIPTADLSTPDLNLEASNNTCVITTDSAFGEAESALPLFQVRCVGQHSDTPNYDFLLADYDFSAIDFDLSDILDRDLSTMDNHFDPSLPPYVSHAPDSSPGVVALSARLNSPAPSEILDRLLQSRSVPQASADLGC
ncbi:hypothetical protein EJ08DRAFT_684323 [Tothia fuscella]|uniref:Uncharacterized protein n=1 Tax=Tothia fuscella TaxID=1048955 RepID=A0A9P4NDT2_9PEZI|nr:hypothetical protein EJ08DRAFT_684323 [Tothia fuscella]